MNHDSFKETLMKEPHRRGDGLKLLTSFSLNDIYPLLFELIKKGINDQSPYIRKIALTGILKVRISFSS
jgi:vesicle coat complex subunit